MYPATAGPSAQFAEWAASFGRGGTDASQGVGACAPGTDEADCNQGTQGYPQDNTRRNQIQYCAPCPEANLGRCEWREGRSASQSRCVYAPDRGCTGWEAAPEILVSPAMSDEATHAFGPGLVSGLREISQAFQQGLPDPVASSWLDVSGWVLDELNTDAWSDVVRAWTLTHHLITPSSLPTCVAAGGAVRAVHRRVLVGGLEPARLRGGPGEHGLLAPCLAVLRFHPDGACRRTWQRSTR